MFKPIADKRMIKGTTGIKYRSIATSREYIAIKYNIINIIL